MSDSGSTQERSQEKLKKNSLGTWELGGVSLAQMAPAYSLFTTLGLVVAGVGFGAPLVFLFAGIATFFHVNTTAEFSRKCPSAGSYTCFISRTFGNYTGITVGVVFVFAQILLIASILLVVGTWIQYSIQQMLGYTINWILLMFMFSLIAVYLCIRGVTISSKFAIALFAFETAVLLVASLVMIATHLRFISIQPFSFIKLFGNFSGLGLAFPLAVYPFLGSSNAAAMAEEAKRPHSTIRIAVFSATIFALLL
ncbi:APC family permease, partial [Acidiphilium sp. AL]|uniref:APC family permease n=1 Tax=Acidiphilium sp. AL TaxID=2871704 RepID=UPI0021CB8A8B